MAQPAFWLSITPAYAIENFEHLFQYVRSYQYTLPEEPESDFNRTVDVVTQIAGELISRVEKCHFEQEPDFKGWGQEIKSLFALRIVAVAFAAEFKRGRYQHFLLAGLIRMLIQFFRTPATYLDGMVRALSACARRLVPERCGYNYPDLTEKSFSVDILCARIASMTWHENNSRAFYEGHGTILFSAGGVEIVAKNHADVLRTDSQRRPVLQPASGVSITSKGGRLTSNSDIDAILHTGVEITHAMHGVKPSPVVQKKEYHDEDMFDVRIVEKSGYRILCESIDPDYVKVIGKIQLGKHVLGVDFQTLLEVLRPGDILPVIYHPDDPSVFETNQSEEFEFKSSFEGLRVKAIYERSFATGSRWATEIGMVVNVSNRSAYEEEYTSDPDPNRVIYIDIKECKYDSSHHIILTGDFVPPSENIEEEEEVDVESFHRTARLNMARCLLDWLRGIGDLPVQSESGPSDISAPKSIADTLGMLMMRAAEQRREITTPDRMEYLVAANVIFECTGSNINRDLARREISYKKALVAFAEGDSPATLSFEPSEEVANYNNTNAERRIVNLLRKYRESARQLVAADYFIREKQLEQYNITEQLIDASNTLIDKIDPGEIARIKKTIAAKLGVGDMYRNLNRQLSFYGYESEQLEFKISCARPPYNMAVASQIENARIQAFIMLKTVCAFLNSSYGGELLIGVNDEGYAEGIASDIDILFAHKLIPERNPDRVRIYLKNIIDRGFVSYSGNAKGTAITAGNVSVNVERCETDKIILRVKVNPYPYDVVKITPENVLPGTGDTFYRSSGASLPLKSDGVRNIRVEKLKLLAPNEFEASTILQAIDSKKQINLMGYRTRNGRKDYRLEPVELNLAEGTFQAFDIRKLQMEQFHISRAKSIELTNIDWSFQRRHAKIKVDVFGYAKVNGSATGSMKMKVTDYALMLLHEENPSYALLPEELYLETPNTDSDKNTYPYIVELKYYDEEGPRRFTAGLPQDVIVL